MSYFPRLADHVFAVDAFHISLEYPSGSAYREIVGAKRSKKHDFLGGLGLDGHSRS